VQCAKYPRKDPAELQSRLSMMGPRRSKTSTKPILRLRECDSLEPAPCGTRGLDAHRKASGSPRAEYRAWEPIDVEHPPGSCHQGNRPPGCVVPVTLRTAGSVLVLSPSMVQFTDAGLSSE
jgi:hypothetical protein